MSIFEKYFSMSSTKLNYISMVLSTFATIFVGRWAYAVIALDQTPLSAEARPYFMMAIALIALSALHVFTAIINAPENRD